jgi:hypothetical protein
VRAEIVDQPVVESSRARACHRWHNALGRGWIFLLVEIRAAWL